MDENKIMVYDCIEGITIIPNILNVLSLIVGDKSKFNYKRCVGEIPYVYSWEKEQKVIQFGEPKEKQWLSEQDYVKVNLAGNVKEDIKTAALGLIKMLYIQDLDLDLFLNINNISKLIRLSADNPYGVIELTPLVDVSLVIESNEIKLDLIQKINEMFEELSTNTLSFILKSTEVMAEKSLKGRSFILKTSSNNTKGIIIDKNNINDEDKIKNEIMRVVEKYYKEIRW